MCAPRVKVCGITSVTDAISAVNAGVDAIGLVFYDPSPRSVSIEQAAIISRSVGPFVTTVGLFVNAEVDFVLRVLAQVPLQVLQFHGDESKEYCEQFQRPYMKAIRMRDDVSVEQEIAAYPSAVAILLDAYRKGVPGGTGESFNWARVPDTATCSMPIVLAGGLTPDNIQQAVLQTQTYGVDVSGGVEVIPGQKDPEKINQFIYHIKTA